MNFAPSLVPTLFVAVIASVSVACSSSSASDSRHAQEPSDEPDGGRGGHPDAGPTLEPDAAGDPEFPNYFAGVVEGTDARVGIVGIDPRTFRLFFCGGPETIGTHTHWFNVADGAIRPAPDGYEWGGVIVPASAKGQFALPDGRRYEFTADPVRWGGLPNLYEATAPCGKVGVIVSPLPETDDVHVQGACIGDVLADAKQVNPILPLTRASDGSIQVRVEGEEDVVVAMPVAR